MHEILFNVIYGGICSLAVLIIGMFLPRSWFDPDSAMFCEREWEHGGKVYNKLHISSWKGRLPDMSRYIKRLLAKRLTGKENAEDVKNLVAETCVAESAHVVLCVLSVGMIIISRDWIGFLCALSYAVGNLPYIIIQRYNRPRLMKMLSRIERRSSAVVSEQI